MSYALGVYDEWLLPFEKKLSDNRLCQNLTEEQMTNHADFMKEYFNLKLVEDISNLDKKIELIAYRIAKEDDFHFLVRKNGRWFHKEGRSRCIGTMKTKEVFSKSWLGRYNSKIMFFIKE